MDFKGKNIIVTGGAGGIGREVAKGIVNGGGKVIIIDINKNAADEVISELGKENCEAYMVDLSNPSEIREVFGGICKKYGYIHGLANVAGIVSTKKFLDTTQEEWDKVLAINLTAMYAAISVVYPNMRDNGGGHIVNVSSIAAKVGGGLLGTCAYATSKAGVIGLTLAIAKEGGKYNINCTGVCPGYTKTAMTSIMTPEQSKNSLSLIPLNRTAKPYEIANVILFLLSDLSSFVTGEIIDADGGVTKD
ncbi:MAG: SDR family NAD(P)-dependent oxidoreductase [Lachnospiraceae bacterium]|nr:SDR family NAD(P)-dependent oxidoreductase [Lachnospiraceae bacterium]